jgi:hypothetical protein
VRQGALASGFLQAEAAGEPVVVGLLWMVDGDGAEFEDHAPVEWNIGLLI